MTIRWFVTCLISSIMLHALLPSWEAYSGAWWFQVVAVGAISYVIAEMFDSIR